MQYHCQNPLQKKPEFAAETRPIVKVIHLPLFSICESTTLSIKLTNPNRAYWSFEGLMIIHSHKSELLKKKIFLYGMNYFVSFIAEKQVA